jgi:hypothetical protein
MAEKKTATPIKYHDGSMVILEFQPKKHWYSIDGEYVPATTSITNVIAKPKLIGWAVGQGARVLGGRIGQPRKVPCRLALLFTSMQRMPCYGS